MRAVYVHSNEKYVSKLFIAGLIVALFLSLFLTTHKAEAASVTIPSNGVQIKDSAGNLLQAHGGGIIKVGSYYYWFGENRSGDNLVACYRSTDLKTWEFRNNVLKHSSAPELATANIERPKVIYNASTGQFVMWMHKENGVDYSEARAAVAYSSTIDGNYTWQGSFQPQGQYMSRDDTLFVDDDGSAYFISSARENLDTHIYKLSSDYRSIASLVQKVWVGSQREAAAMFKRNGVYFLVTSGATGWAPNQMKYGTATSIAGTWSALSNVGDGTSFDSQPAYIVPVQGTSTTSYLYIGDRWAGAWGGIVNDSRYVFLPISFPSNTSMSLTYYDKLTIDTATGTISGSNYSINSTTNYKILNRNSNKSLAVSGTDKTLSAAPIQQFTDTTSLFQRWQFVKKANGYYSIINKQSGKYMDINGQSTADGATNIQYASNGGKNQEWLLVDLENGYYAIENRNSRKFMDISGSSTADGGQNIQYTWNGGNNQQWTIN